MGRAPIRGRCLGFEAQAREVERQMALLKLFVDDGGFDWLPFWDGRSNFEVTQSTPRAFMIGGVVLALVPVLVAVISVAAHGLKLS